MAASYIEESMLTASSSAYKLRKYLQDEVEFCILEKNSDLGGTWFENRYPGKSRLEIVNIPWANN